MKSDQWCKSEIHLLDGVLKNTSHKKNEEEEREGEEMTNIQFT